MRIVALLTLLIAGWDAELKNELFGIINSWSQNKPHQQKKTYIERVIRDVVRDIKKIQQVVLKTIFSYPYYWELGLVIALEGCHCSRITLSSYFPRNIPGGEWPWHTKLVFWSCQLLTRCSNILVGFSFPCTAGTCMCACFAKDNVLFYLLLFPIASVCASQGKVYAGG